MHRRVVATAALVLEAFLALIGLMLALNMLSLRDLVLETHLYPAIAVAFDTRDEMEFLTGLAEMILCWLRRGGLELREATRTSVWSPDSGTTRA